MRTRFLIGFETRYEKNSLVLKQQSLSNNAEALLTPYENIPDIKVQ